MFDVFLAGVYLTIMEKAGLSDDDDFDFDPYILATQNVLQDQCIYDVFQLAKLSDQDWERLANCRCPKGSQIPIGVLVVLKDAIRNRSDYFSYDPDEAELKPTRARRWFGSCLPF